MLSRFLGSPPPLTSPTHGVLTLSGHEFDTIPQCRCGATVCETLNDRVRASASYRSSCRLRCLAVRGRQNLQVQEHAGAHLTCTGDTQSVPEGALPWLVSHVIQLS